MQNKIRIRIEPAGIWERDRSKRWIVCDQRDCREKGSDSGRMYRLMLWNWRRLVAQHHGD